MSTQPVSGKEQFSPKDKVQILLKEYDALRGEITSRGNNMYQLIAICAGIGAALISWLAPRGLNAMGWTVLVSTTLLFAWLFIALDRDIKHAAARVRELEAAINELSGTELLQWETYWGGAVSGILRRTRPGVMSGPIKNRARTRVIFK
jgi:hypothetical protein